MALPTTRPGWRTVETLVVDSNPQSMDLTGAILRGLGIGRMTRCASAAQAREAFHQVAFDLILIDADMAEGEAFALMSDLRGANGGVNFTTPVLMLSAETSMARVAMARDAGAAFLIAKPVAPAVLWDRLVWIAQSNRPFVDSGGYRGPDRRFRLAPPPRGVEERRASVLKLVASPERALSQNEIDGLFG